MKSTCILICVLICVGAEKKLPSFIEQCYKNDPYLSECVTKNIKNIQPRLEKGIPELQVPSFSPLKVTSAEIRSNDLAIDLINIDLYHVDNFVLKKLDIDLKNMIWNVSLELSSIGLETDYRLNGKLLSYQLYTTGQAIGNLTGIQATHSLKLGVVERNLLEYLTIKEVEIKLQIDGYRFSLDRIFADKNLTRQANKLINEGDKIILKQLTPFLEIALKDTVFNVYENVFKKFPYNLLFPVN